MAQDYMGWNLDYGIHLLDLASIQHTKSRIHSGHADLWCSNNLLCSFAQSIYQPEMK